MKIIKSIAQFHQLLSLPDPQHPLLSVVRVEEIRPVHNRTLESFVPDFFSISLKWNIQAKLKYGQQYYDFNKGTMSFTGLKQLQSHDITPEKDIGKGVVLFFHPDFLSGHPLAARINSYGFFSYATHEALHLSGKEEADMIAIFQKIEQECQHIDRHTQEIILSQIDLLLKYSNRFYERQFITRKTANSDLLAKTEQILYDHFNTTEGLNEGLLTVEQLADRLHVSPHYLSDMLRTLTGQNAQLHIHEKLIEKAKEYLSLTSLSVSQIAYELGFEYSQSFNKLFKKKTNQSPLEFRRSFN